MSGESGHQTHAAHSEAEIDYGVPLFLDQLVNTLQSKGQPNLEIGTSAAPGIATGWAGWAPSLMAAWWLRPGGYEHPDRLRELQVQRHARGQSAQPDRPDDSLAARQVAELRRWFELPAPRVSHGLGSVRE